MADAPNHKNASIGQLAGRAVAGEIDLAYFRRHQRGQARTKREVASPRGNDDGARMPLPQIGHDAVPASIPLHGLNVCAVHDGRADVSGVTGEIAGEFCCRHEGLRIGQMRQAGQRAARIRRQEVQRIPSFAEPALTGAAALEHDVLDAQRGKTVAHDETGLACADDDHVRLGHAVLLKTEK